jgi:hypothetical protein
MGMRKRTLIKMIAISRFVNNRTTGLQPDGASKPRSGSFV